MIQGRKNLIEWFKMQNKPVFAIFRKTNLESGNVVYTNKDRAEDETIETAAAYLEQCLSLISTGDFFMYCHKKDGSPSKGRSETFFSLNMSESPLQQKTENHISGIAGQFDYETMMGKAKEMAKEEFEKMQAKKELADTQLKLKEVEKEKRELEQRVQKPWQKIVEEVSPYIGSIAEQLGFKAKTLATPLPISNIPADETLEENVSATDVDRLNTVVNNFCEAMKNQYPDTWLDIIEKLTHTLKTNPGKIDMAIKFL